MSALCVVPENIPPHMKQFDQWALFQLQPQSGKPKPKKMPYQAIMSEQKPADISDPSTWAPFRYALTVLELCTRFKYDGLLFAITGDDPFTFIDLDNCRNPETGEVTEWAMRIVRRMDAYWEISPSGKGIHCFLRGKLPPGRRRKGDIEMYDSGRFATVTGQLLEVAR